MLAEFEAITMLGVLEYDGLIHVEAGVLRTTPRFQRSLDAARRTKQKSVHPDLRDSVASAMRSLYAKYLSEDEMRSLVEAMLPIASAEPEGAPQKCD